MINSELLSILYNPLTGTPFDFFERKRLSEESRCKIPEYIERGLMSKDKREVYPILSGIPMLLKKNALRLDSQEEFPPEDDSIKEDVVQYFDDSWKERQKKRPFWADDGFSYSLCQLDIIKRLGNLRGKRVLLLGAGRSRESKAFVERGAWVVTSDIGIKGLLEDATGVFRVVTDAEKLYFWDESFDLVYGQSMLMFTHPQRVYGEVSRVLRRGGKYATIEPNSDSYLWPLCRLLGRFHKYTHLKNNPPNYLNEKAFDEMRAAFGKILYQNCFFVTPYCFFLKMLKLEKTASWYLEIENKILKRAPLLKKHAYMKIHILQKL